MGGQVFEEIRASLSAQTRADAEIIPKDDAAIHSLLRSIQGFGPAMVSARMVSLDHKMSWPPTRSGVTRSCTIPPFSELMGRVARWLSPSMAPLHGGQPINEVTRPVYRTGSCSKRFPLASPSI
jgi:hypothetical protein